MSSNDVRDMLNLPSAAGPRPAKKQKTAGPRPNLKGLQREVQSLGGDNPIAIVPEISQFKKRRFASRKPAARWELKPFKNSARNDGLILKHWRRVNEVPPPTAPPAADGQEADVTETKPDPEIDDSLFAKFNVEVQLPRYNDDQYNANLQNPDWTKEETDYLMELVFEYDLRWVVIWDRYDFHPQVSSEEGAEGDNTALIPAPKVRTLEDLKARYYEIAAKMMAVQKPVQYMGQAEFTLHELMSNFNPTIEKARKQFAENALARSYEEKREEESLLVELKRIMARSERLNEERRELYARLEAPPSTSNISMYTTSAGLQQLMAQLTSADKDKKRKSIRGPEGMSPAVSSASGAQAAPFDRRESGAQRESISGPSSASNKKGPPPPNERRKLTEEEERIFGVTHHERLTGGPVFRHEKVNRQLTSKSTVQAAKIANILAELEIPPRLVMPTADVVVQYEQLLGAVNVLLDAKKVSDKLDTEIKVATTAKAEREKKIKTETEDSAATGGNGTAEGEGDDKAGSKGDEDAEIAQPNGDAAEDGAEEASKDEANVEDGASAANNEDNQSLKAGSGALHKRSASVLSAVSDKSSKRQKK